MSETMTTPDYLRMTIDSGVSPLEMRFSQINSCHGKYPIALYSSTFINSVVVGVVPPEKYSFAADATDRGIRIAKWNIEEAIRTIKEFEQLGKLKDIEFITARCPARLASEVDIYEWVKEIFDSNRFYTPEKICLEFPQSLLFEDIEKARLAILNMKILKVKTMMSGCAAEDCPIQRLIHVPVDYVMVDPKMTTLIDNRNKGNVVTSLLNYLTSMHIGIIGAGVYNDEQITLLSRADCFGYIPSSGYSGSVNHGLLRMTLDEAINLIDREAN